MPKHKKKRKSFFGPVPGEEQDDSDEAFGSVHEKREKMIKKYSYNLEDKLNDKRFDEFSPVLLKKLRGSEFSVQFCQEGGFICPILFEEKDGLNLKLPRKDFSVKDVRRLIGAKRVIDVMDVSTQRGLRMTLKDFVKYYKKPPEKRENKLLNVLSLEFSKTKLNNVVQGPKVIKELDWVELAWPSDLRQSQEDETNAMRFMMYPKVQNYCLMSVAGCYTDFHVDFGGTSVWYHVLKGEKVFWLAPPTDENLQRYEAWTLSTQQHKVFFGDFVEQCIKVHLTAGNTFMIPSGWIHAVYTPVDSLVFGGNFLHSFAIPIQLRVFQVEQNTHVPAKFRYPFFQEMQWYVVNKYFAALTGLCVRQNPDVSCASEFSVRISNDLSLNETKEKVELDDEISTPCSSKNVDPDFLTPVEQQNEQNLATSTFDFGLFPIENDEKFLYSIENVDKMTEFEVEGLKFLVDFLRTIPENRRKVPQTILGPDILLKSLKEILNNIVPCKNIAELNGRTIINNRSNVNYSFIKPEISQEMIFGVEKDPKKSEQESILVDQTIDEVIEKVMKIDNFGHSLSSDSAIQQNLGQKYEDFDQKFDFFNQKSEFSIQEPIFSSPESNFSPKKSDFSLFKNQISLQTDHYYQNLHNFNRPSTSNFTNLIPKNVKNPTFSTNYDQNLNNPHQNLNIPGQNLNIPDQNLHIPIQNDNLNQANFYNMQINQNLKALFMQEHGHYAAKMPPSYSATMPPNVTNVAPTYAANMPPNYAASTPYNMRNINPSSSSFKGQLYYDSIPNDAGVYAQPETPQIPFSGSYVDINMPFYRSSQNYGPSTTNNLATFVQDYDFNNRNQAVNQNSNGTVNVEYIDQQYST